MKFRQPQPRWRKRRRRLPGGLLLLVLAVVALLLSFGLVKGLLAFTASLAGPGTISTIIPSGTSTTGLPSVTAPSPAVTARPRVGSPAPEFRIQDVDGQTLDLAQLRGKVVLVNFWASWCKPCEAEMADLQALHAQESARGFTVVGVNEGEEPTRAAEFLKNKGITFPTGFDADRTVTRRYEVLGLPNSVLIDGNGVIRDRVVGALTIEQMQSRVERVFQGQQIEPPRLFSVWAAMGGENDRPAGELLGASITVGEVNRRLDLENALTLLRGGIPPEFSTDEGRTRLKQHQRVILERLVDERLIGARAASVGLTIPDAQIEADLQRIASETGLDVAGLERQLESLGSSIGLLAETQRAAHLVGTYLLEYVLTGRAVEGIEDPDAWLVEARARAGVRLLLP